MVFSVVVRKKRGWELKKSCNFRGVGWGTVRFLGLDLLLLGVLGFSQLLLVKVLSYN